MSGCFFQNIVIFVWCLSQLALFFSIGGAIVFAPTSPYEKKTISFSQVFLEFMEKFRKIAGENTKKEAEEELYEKFL